MGPRAAFAAFVFTTFASSAVGQATFTDLGSFHPRSVSADGTTVVGNHGGQVALYDVAAGTITPIGAQLTLGGITGDGSNVCGIDSTGPYTADYYDGSILIHLDGPYGTHAPFSRAHDISSDGSTVVGSARIGLSGSCAARWKTNGDIVEPLGSIGCVSGRANGVSADGSVAVGFDADGMGFNRPAYWPHGPGSTTLLPSLDPTAIYTVGECWAVSASGETVVGWAYNGSFSEAFRFEGGNIVGLGVLPSKTSSEAFAVSDGGHVIVGTSDSGVFGASAFVWTTPHGMRDLRLYLLARGATLGNAHLTHAYDCSSDGSVIVGVHRFSGSDLGFIATIPPLSEGQAYCTAKVNSLGCTPAIQGTGIATVSGGPGSFVIDCSPVLNQKAGLLFYGLAASAIPFQGGFLCVQPPTTRTPIQSSGGNPPPDDCSGAHSFDFGGWIHSGSDPTLSAGTSVYAQYWMRDPGAAVAPSVLSDGFEFTIVQ